jgi:hypothetical protein
MWVGCVKGRIQMENALEQGQEESESKRENKK